MNEKELIERLAEVIHEIWIVWTQHIVDREEISKEKLEMSEERLDKWKDYWIPYSELSEEVKELDRYWARKIVKLLKEMGVFNYD